MHRPGETSPCMPPFPTLDRPAFLALAAAPGLTVIDVTAAWCGPCRVLGTVLDAVAADYGDRLRVVALDVDAEPALAQQLGVRSMPTVVLWRDGREVGRFVGSRPRAFVTGVIERALAGDVAIAAP